MPHIYFSYIHAFKNYADLLLKQFAQFNEIGRYAILLTQRADELLRRAALNKKVNLANLEREIYDTGIVYIRKFSGKFQPKLKSA